MALGMAYVVAKYGWDLSEAELKECSKTRNVQEYALVGATVRFGEAFLNEETAQGTSCPIPWGHTITYPDKPAVQKLSHATEDKWFVVAYHCLSIAV